MIDTTFSRAYTLLLIVAASAGSASVWLAHNAPSYQALWLAAGYPIGDNA